MSLSKKLSVGASINKYKAFTMFIKMLIKMLIKMFMAIIISHKSNFLSKRVAFFVSSNVFISVKKNDL